jgi:hypothetical protein
LQCQVLNIAVSGLEYRIDVNVAVSGLEPRIAVRCQAVASISARAASGPDGRSLQVDVAAVADDDAWRRMLAEARRIGDLLVR